MCHYLNSIMLKTSVDSDMMSFKLNSDFIFNTVLWCLPRGTQIWVGQGCAARASKPIPIFKGDFGQKSDPLERHIPVRPICGYPPPPRCLSRFSFSLSIFYEGRRIGKKKKNSNLFWNWIQFSKNSTLLEKIIKVQVRMFSSLKNSELGNVNNYKASYHG